MKVKEYIRELEKYNPNMEIKKSIPTRDDCFLQEPIKPSVIMVDVYKEVETKTGTLLSYTYSEQKPILLI